MTSNHDDCTLSVWSLLEPGFPLLHTFGGSFAFSDYVTNHICFTSRGAHTLLVAEPGCNRVQVRACVGETGPARVRRHLAGKCGS